MRNSVRLHRRAALCGMAGALVAGGFAARDASADETPPRTGLGLVLYNASLRRQMLRRSDATVDLFEPLTFLKHCHAVGAGGMQASLAVMDASRIRALREFAERHKLFIDAIISPPKDDADLMRFEAEVKTAVEVGALAARSVVMPGRRYEQFASLAEFRSAEQLAEQMLRRAAPIVTKHRLRLAVENHKDQRIDERLALYKRLDCEFIGACVDTGNSFALLDDPLETIRALSPYAFTVHLKDQALQPYADGFLLGDIPLGQGAFDLPEMVEILKKAKPNLRFVLELLTRDALRVPCLTEKYWATMPGVAAIDLARALRFVRDHTAKSLPQVSALPLDKQVELEDSQVAASLKYARETLRM